MNVEQAHDILMGLGIDDDFDARRRAVGVVLDLLREEQVTVEPPSVNQQMVEDLRRSLADREGAPFPGPPRSMNEANADIARLRHENEVLTAAVETWAELWRRVEELLGTSPVRGPDAVINRVEFLAKEEERLLNEITNRRAERDELLAAARVVVGGDLGRYEEIADLDEVVARIDRQNETPAAGAARLRVE